MTRSTIIEILPARYKVCHVVLPTGHEQSSVGRVDGQRRSLQGQLISKPQQDLVLVRSVQVSG